MTQPSRWGLPTFLQACGREGWGWGSWWPALEPETRAARAVQHGAGWQSQARWQAGQWPACFSGPPCGWHPPRRACGGAAGRGGGARRRGSALAAGVGQPPCRHSFAGCCLTAWLRPGAGPALVRAAQRQGASQPRAHQVGSFSLSTRLRPSATTSPVCSLTTTAPKQPPAGGRVLSRVRRTGVAAASLPPPPHCPPPPRAAERGRPSLACLLHHAAVAAQGDGAAHEGLVLLLGERHGGGNGRARAGQG